VADRATQVAEQLTRALRGLGVDAAVALGGRATVGLSQETWFADVTVAGAVRPVVLRLPTPSSGHRTIVTQRRALDAVAGRIPAPGVAWSDDGDDNPFGHPYLVMDRATGQVPVGWHVLAPPERAVLAERAIDVLADLHAIDPDRLADDRPPATPAEELARYARRLERLGPLPLVLRYALRWLDARAPGPADRPTIVHGDFRMGNLVVADRRIVAALDWEMASTGDPLADLTWCFIPVWEPAGVDEDALVRRYADATGVPVDAGRLHWHRVLAFVRLAFYALSGLRAFDAGASDDLRLAALRYQLPVQVDRLARTLDGRAIE
jgi:aminoglycoside phosphotransferase (APT) family kinase protein